MKILDLVEQLLSIMEQDGNLEIIGDHEKLVLEVMQQEDEFIKCLYIG